MKTTTTSEDIQSDRSSQESEALDADYSGYSEWSDSLSDTLTCSLCQQPIREGDATDLHHPTPRSEGGIETVPVHKACHVRHHSSNGHFREWGKIGGKITAASMRWALNLRNVQKHPAYDFARSFYAAHYAH